MFITYILFNPESGKFYSGQTIDIDRRLEEHSENKKL
jgi:predicted GIY-YIG superfamily endonuclease